MVFQDNYLIKRFLDALSSTQSALAEGNLSLAKENYKKLHGIYLEIDNSQLESFHKEIAYDQLSKVYSQLKENKTNGGIPVNFVLVACVIVILSILVVFKPSVIGLVFLEGSSDGSAKFVEIDAVFDTSADYPFLLESVPKSLSLSGTFEGEGTVKVFLERGENSLLVFDSEITPLKEGKFENVCIETCSLQGYSSNAVKLNVVVDGGKLRLTRIRYAV